MMAASDEIDNYIAKFADWRGDMLAGLRTLIKQADPKITEEWKWNSPVWSKNGMIVSISAFKDHIGINFFNGASLPDPAHIFNGGLDAKKLRAVNLRAGETIDKASFQNLIRAAAKLNTKM